MIGSAEEKFRKTTTNVYKLESSMALKESDVMDTANQACRRVFPFFNTCAPGSLPGSWSHFTGKQKAKGIHPFGPINAKIRFPTGTETRDLFTNGTRKTTEEAGRFHLP